MGRLPLAGKALPRIDFAGQGIFFQTRFSIDSHLETSVISPITLFHIQPAGFDGARSETANPAEQGRRVPLSRNRAGLRDAGHQTVLWLKLCQGGFHKNNLQPNILRFEVYWTLFCRTRGILWLPSYMKCRHQPCLSPTTSVLFLSPWANASPSSARRATSRRSSSPRRLACPSRPISRMR